jgi:hypothetical protein
LNPYRDAYQVWSELATLSGLPATAVPIDRSENGLPIGVQIVGPYLEERTTIAFAELLEREFGGFVAPPRTFKGVLGQRSNYRQRRGPGKFRESALASRP